MTKTKTQMEQEILGYLQKTSKHLFINDKGLLMKVITFKRNDEWHYATLRFNETTAYVSIRKVLSDADYQYYGNNSKQIVKANLFSDKNLKSIPNFKAARKLTEEITKLLTDGKSEKEITEYITESLKTLTLQKAA
jgi:hypothetical protein